MIETVHVAGGLTRDRVQALSALVAEVTGAAPSARPVLAPALLLSDPGVQQVMALPYLTQDAVLLQDYQSLNAASEIPLDVPLDPFVEKHAAGANTEFTCTPFPGVVMKSGLRLLPRAELGEIAPMRLRGPDVLATVTCRQAQVDRYLALSGDGNPMHSDQELAQRLGLAAPIVPGLLLISLVQPYVEAQAPTCRIMSLRARFAAPILADQPVSIGVIARGSERFRAVLFGDDGAFALVDLTVVV